MRHAAQITVLVFTLAATGSCTSGPPPPPGTPLSTSTFGDLRAAFNQADFRILFDVDIEGVTGEVLWTKVADVERWDMFYRSERGDPLPRGVAIVTVEGKEAGGCWWIMENAAVRQAYCGLGGPLDFATLLHVPLLLYTFAYRDSATILDLPADCFESHMGSRLRADFCFTKDGLPLAVNATYSTLGPGDLRAKAIWPLIPKESLLDLPRYLPESEPGSVAVESLDLPQLPELVAYLQDPEHR